MDIIDMQLTSIKPRVLYLEAVLTVRCREDYTVSAKTAESQAASLVTRGAHHTIMARVEMARWESTRNASDDDSSNNMRYPRGRAATARSSGISETCLF